MHLVVPQREELLNEYRQAEKYGQWWFFLDLALIALTLVFLNTNQVKNSPLEALILVCASIGPTLLSLLYLYVQKKKRVEDLRPDVRFGEITKANLLKEIQSVFLKMGVSPGDITLYITAEKQVNAAALALGLGRVMPKLRAIYLNRGTLHALSPKELSSVIAHELAHIYRYPLGYQKGLFLHLITATLLALTVWSLGVNLMIALFVIGGYFFCLNFVFARYSQTIEYLCDDCGAEIAGIDAALRAEFRIAQHSEIVSRAYCAALEKKLSGQEISSKDLQAVLEDALTFDPPNAEDLEREVLLRMKSKETRSKNSFFHFIRDIVFSDSQDALGQHQEILASLKKAAKSPTLELPLGDGFTREWFGELVNRIKAEPSKILFRVPEELSDADSTHPGPRKRMLYLWQSYC